MNFLLCLCFIFTVSLGKLTERFVNNSVSLSGDGLSWITAFKTVVESYDVDEVKIIIAEGTYDLPCHTFDLNQVHSSIEGSGRVNVFNTSLLPIFTPFKKSIIFNFSVDGVIGCTLKSFIMTVPFGNEITLLQLDSSTVAISIKDVLFTGNLEYFVYYQKGNITLEDTIVDGLALKYGLFHDGGLRLSTHFHFWRFLGCIFSNIMITCNNAGLFNCAFADSVVNCNDPSNFEIEFDKSVVNSKVIVENILVNCSSAIDTKDSWGLIFTFGRIPVFKVSCTTFRNVNSVNSKGVAVYQASIVFRANTFSFNAVPEFANVDFISNIGFSAGAIYSLSPQKQKYTNVTFYNNWRTNSSYGPSDIFIGGSLAAGNKFLMSDFVSVSSTSCEPSFSIVISSLLPCYDGNPQTVCTGEIDKKDWNTRKGIHEVDVHICPKILRSKGNFFGTLVAKTDALALFSKNRRFDLIYKIKWAQAMNQREPVAAFYRHMYSVSMYHLNNCNKTLPKRNDSIDNFLRDFDKLMKNVEKKKIDSRDAIPVVSNGELINGTHRLAACVALGKEITVRVVGSDLDYYFDHLFFSGCELPLIVADWGAQEYVRLNKNAFIVNLFPVLPTCLDVNVDSILNEYGFVYYKKSLRLSFNGCINLKRINYGADKDWTINQAEKSMGGMEKGIMRAWVFVCENPKLLVIAKKKIRELMSIGNSVVHINDFHKEAVELAETYFNENSWLAINSRPFEVTTKYLDDLVTEFKEYLKMNKYSTVNFCACGSASMGVFNLREIKDMDILHLNATVVKPVNAKLELNYDVDSAYYPHSIEDIILNPQYHFYYRGVKFISLEVLFQMKAKKRRSKDVRDLKLISEFIHESNLRMGESSPSDIISVQGHSVGEFKALVRDKKHPYGTGKELTKGTVNGSDL